MADGQVTMGGTVVKPNVRKTRKIGEQVVGGFAGGSGSGSGWARVWGGGGAVHTVSSALHGVLGNAAAAAAAAGCSSCPPRFPRAHLSPIAPLLPVAGSHTLPPPPGSRPPGIAGATADAFTLFERLESKLEEHSGQLTR